MQKRMALLLFSMLLFSVIPSPVFAEEELFDTKTAAAFIEKGIAHLKAKNYDAAIGEFEESAAVYPDAEAYYYLGYAYYLKSKKGDGENRQKAAENFEKAYEINPSFTPSKFKPAEPMPVPALRQQGKAAEPQTVSPESPASAETKDQPVQPPQPVEPSAPQPEKPAEQPKP